MVYKINPTAISNSGNQEYFTNKRATISKKVLNIISNADDYNDFLVQEFNKSQTNTGLTTQSSSSTNNNDFITILQNQRNNSKINNFKY